MMLGAIGRKVKREFHFVFFNNISMFKYHLLGGGGDKTARVAVTYHFSSSSLLVNT